MPIPKSMAIPSSLKLFLLLLCFSSTLLSPTCAQETDAGLLLSLKETLANGQDNLLLSTWNSSEPLCQWRGVEWQKDFQSLDCNSSQVRTDMSLFNDASIFVSAIELSGAGLGGTIPADLAKLSQLRKLFLNVNMLRGPVPLELGNALNLAFLSLGQNLLNNTIPASIWNLCGNLVELNLGHNGLAGPIPEPPEPNTSCPNLQKLDLSNNRLSGPIPTFISSFKTLALLDLSNNSLSGPVPHSYSNLTHLTVLNLSENNLSGAIPSFFQNFSSESFLGNSPALCGPPLDPCGTPRPTKGGLSPGAVAGIVIALMASMVTLVSILIVLATSRDRRRDYRNDFEEEETVEGRLVLFEGGEHLTVDDVLNATGQVLGKTSYGTVYKAKLVNGGTIVLRLLREGTATEREQFLSAITDLGRLRHENLVPLRAFYEGERGEKLLVYDFMPKGSLADLLYASGRQNQSLSWARRHKIALGTARGLAHLHTGLERAIIHGNLKSKNVLVDEYYVAHLTDYGLDKLMSAGASAEMMGASNAEGYKAPELHKMSKANTKTDVYSFGILLLEMLLGRRPSAEDLPSIVKGAVLEERVMQVFDAEILRSSGSGRNPSSVDDGILLQALQLAMGCCAPSPTSRPDILQVVRQLEDMRPKLHSPLYTPKSANLD
eukprot:TRINITY_DN4294_c0_g1_i1.p1 TRINITY_DN4294_c0_g1~~TRINITY_DN4294_c0_g1_i1.p1  ORF type:complete len:661 (-),score=69.51 TRINITY_DN4294_c0_g1_i1:82-2064(-)